MEATELLKNTWPTKEKNKAQRSTALITPINNLKSGEGTISPSDWNFIVPYGFREALDIKYEKRMKNQKAYYVWTQGPILSFKEGDTLQNKFADSTVQVKFASSMGWDPDKNVMYLGSVVFDVFDVDHHKHKKVSRMECNQMEFLQFIIYGKIAC
jgi:hypothetical protein